MGRLDGVTLEKLHEVREQTEGEIPREQVLAAIGRKQGDYTDTLAERHDVAEKTIRNWLDRFEKNPIEQAPYDDPRPRRPSKLEEDDHDHRPELFEQLQQPPTDTVVRDSLPPWLVKKRFSKPLTPKYVSRSRN
jgi:transposase